MVMIGLTGENITRLNAGQPIRLLLPEQAQGVPTPRLLLGIVAGATLADVAAQLATPEVAVYLADHPPSPGQTLAVEVDDDEPDAQAAEPTVTVVELPDGVTGVQAEAAIALCRRLGLRVVQLPRTG
jgi:hypothetical protein